MTPWVKVLVVQVILWMTFFEYTELTKQQQKSSCGILHIFCTYSCGNVSGGDRTALRAAKPDSMAL